MHDERREGACPGAPSSRCEDPDRDVPSVVGVGTSGRSSEEEENRGSRTSGKDSRASSRSVGTRS